MVVLIIELINGGRTFILREEHANISVIIIT